MPPPHTPPTPQYLFILMTERAPIIFCRILAHPMPPLSPNATILTILITEKGRHYVCRILAPPMPPPPLTTPQYLTILMTERGSAIIFCRILAPPPLMPPSPDVTILNYLNDRERGRGHYFFVGFWRPPNAPPPLPRRHNI